MREFIEELLATGRARLKGDDEPSADETQAAVETLLRMESEFRCTLPGRPPAVDPLIAVWGLKTLYRLCQFHVYRHLGPDEIEQRFRDTPPDPGSASAHYSVDLTLRFLPDMAQLVRNTSADDPLFLVVKGLTETWPLSSVGVPDVESQNLEPVLADDCLRQMYVDRVIRHRDRSRSEHPTVQEEIRRVAGGYPELAAGLITEPAGEMESTS